MKARKSRKAKYFRRQLFQPLEVMGVWALLLVIRLMPAGLAVRLGTLLGLAAFDLFRIRRRVTLINLEFAFPKLTKRERTSIGRRSYAHLGRTFMEFLLLARVDERYLERHVTIENLEVVDRVLEEGKGFVIVTGHYGNWEIMGAAFARRGYPLDVIAFTQKNKGMNHFINSVRGRHGMGIITITEAGRGILRSLRKNRAVALLSDQDARRGNAGVVVNFFGRPTSVYEGAALFHLKVGAPIICAFCVRQGSVLDHHVTAEPPLEFTPTGNRDEDVKKLAQLHASRLEEWIIKHPDHWFWCHKRWKTMGLYD